MTTLSWSRSFIDIEGVKREKILVSISFFLQDKSPAVNGFVPQVLNIKTVDHLVALQLYCLIHSVGLHAGQHLQLVLDDRANNWSISQSLTLFSS